MCKRVYIETTIPSFYNEFGRPMPLLTTPLNYLSGGNPMPDEEIAAFRRVRHEISEECAHDVHKVAAYYRAAGKQLRLSGEFRREIPQKEKVLPADSVKAT